MKEFETFKEKARTANVIPVVDTLPADLLTPLAVYLKLSAGTEHSFLLESVEGGESLARYSFIGAGPQFTVIGNNESVQVIDESGSTGQSVPMMRFLREHFAKYHVFQDETLPSFIGGAIGALNFDCVTWFEPSLKQTEHTDDLARLMFFRSIVAFDHAKQLIQIISLVFRDEADGSDSELEGLWRSARANNNRIRHCLENGAVQLPSAFRDAVSGAATSNYERSVFEEHVGEIKELINAGEAYQVVISQ